LLRFDEIHLQIGHRQLLRSASFTIDQGERICLIGRNGAGKTTLFRIIMGEVEPDSGAVVRRSGLRISRLEQTLPEQLHETVYEHVAGGLAGLRRLIDQYHALSNQPLDRSGLRTLEELQQRIEVSGGWQIDTRVQTLLTEMQLPPGRRLEELSSGWQRRVSLARALVSHPELLLLDEPTNHLDLSAIQWLEDRCYGFPGSILFVTHDRYFMQRLATRILELDRGKLTSWPGDYRKFQIAKTDALAAEQRVNKLFDKKLEQEETWIRQGIKARRTRNKGRVRALETMREQAAARVKPDAKPRLYIEDAEASGHKVIDAYNLGFDYDGVKLFQGLRLRIRRGQRIGLIGNNGVGKSTLLRLLMGRLTPKQGTVKHGANLVIGYFDQQREQLDPDKTVAQVVGGNSDHIKINGKDRHVIGYLKGFLFSYQRALTKVKALSGGERNRVILAKLLTKPANLRVMDEPTNDLDVETLEVLEDRLNEYEGTLIIVSHDREFLDNVITSTLVFEADGQVRAYPGGYSDWLRQGKHLRETDDPHLAQLQAGEQILPPKIKPVNKLSYKLKLELAQLPGQIAALETAVAALHAQTQQSGFFNQGYDRYQPILDELTRKEQELEQAIDRWSELETLQNDLLPKNAR
jgi:ATP-binding cassette subfamily F protein uup